MDFPHRIKQHKAESDSFAILLYKLKDVGIFRNATENDYGIDLELEIVINEKVIGRYLKVQVKSSDEINIRKKDGVPTVGRIKQSTLLYWVELSFRSHVVACAVDLKTEKIYISKPLFWQATTLLDNTEKTKSIEFLPAFDLTEQILSGKVSEKSAEEMENKIQELILKKFAFDSGIPDVIFAHKTILRNIKSIFELYADTWHYDAWTEVQQVDVFKTFLDCSKILIPELPEVLENFNEGDKYLIFNFEYWSKKTDWGSDEVSNQEAKIPLKILLPLLINQVKMYSDLVLEGQYYWKSKDRTYLNLTKSVELPSELNHEELIDLGNNPGKLIKKNAFEDY